MFFMLEYVTSSSRNCWVSKLVFVLGGKQLNKQCPYVTYLTCTVHQDVCPPSFLSTSIRLLMSLTDVLLQKYCQCIVYQSFSSSMYGVAELLIVSVWCSRASHCQCKAVLHRDFWDSNGHGTRKHWIIFNDIWCCSRWHTGAFPLRHHSWLRPSCNPNGSCLFAAGLPADIVGNQSFQTFSTRQTPHLGDWWGELTTTTTTSFMGPSGSCLFETGSPTDTVDRHSYRTFFARQFVILVVELPLPALLLRLPYQCARYVETNPAPVSTPTHISCLRLSQWNANGISGKITELLTFLCSNNVNISAIKKPS